MSERLAVAIGLVACFAAGPARGQEGSEPEVPPPAADPAIALDQAHDAQRAFERVRRRHFARAGWGVDACHEQVGRFCLNHDEDDDWIAPPEHPEVVAARARLIATLDSVARVLPEDGWIHGQRVRYRIEAGRRAESLALTGSCGAQSWWCEGLAGFALHLAGRAVAADAAFARALRLMTEPQRCAWTDLARVLEGRDAARYGRLACGSAGRTAFERAFWHLSDPLWLVPGNQRRAEHYARGVWAALQPETASGYGLPWGSDLTELTMRYGWPSGWDVLWRRRPGIGTDRSIRAHRPPESQRFTVSELGRPARDGGPVWALEDERPLSTWAPPYGSVEPLAHQIAGFWRGDQRLIVGAFAAPEALGGCPVRSAIFLANAFQVLERAESTGTLPLRVSESGTPGSATLVGIETRCAEGAGAARVRAPLAITDKRLSDLLLLDSVAELPGTLNAAAFHARRGPTARGGETVVVYWEWYGPIEPSASLAITLSLTREDESFWRNVLEWTGLADRDREAVGIRWREPGDPDSPARALELRLPDLEPGRYRLALRVQSARVGAVSSHRELVIVP